ncbi:MAG: hypothetical protein LBV41_03280 [Cytophagaceae bacterium]|jgi:hypothetical protein|nr:hypothetical protein [Cytophagaceae bacterium]
MKRTILTAILCTFLFSTALQAQDGGLSDTTHYKITHNVELPYKGGIDIKTVGYDTTVFKEQGGYDYVERYIPLLKHKEVSLVLIPMDEGDFAYRFYLYVIKNGRRVFGLYVEGEWYEHYNNKEYTSFELFKSGGGLYVTVTTVWDLHDYMGSGGTKTYRISDTGEIVEAEPSVMGYGSIEGTNTPQADTLLVAAVNDNTLIITETEEARLLCYFLLDAKGCTVDSMEFTTGRETIIHRKIRDWNGDGLQDIVETRKYQGQMFSAITDVVYSVVDNRFRRIFSIDTHELNCTTPDERDNGVVIRREYEQVKPNVFRVFEVEGYVRCGDNPDIPDNAEPFKIIGSRQYEATYEELLNRFGRQYDR